MGRKKYRGGNKVIEFIAEKEAKKYRDIVCIRDKIYDLKWEIEHKQSLLDALEKENTEETRKFLKVREWLDQKIFDEKWYGGYVEIPVEDWMNKI